MAIEAGQRLLHYRLIEKIGEGGMGVVWKALDANLDREVAIKVLPEAIATDPDRLRRFETVILFEMAHTVPSPRNRAIKEVLRWADRVLGPVRWGVSDSGRPVSAECLRGSTDFTEFVRKPTKILDAGRKRDTKTGRRFEKSSKRRPHPRPSFFATRSTSRICVDRSEFASGCKLGDFQHRERAATW